MKGAICIENLVMRVSASGTTLTLKIWDRPKQALSSNGNGKSVSDYSKIINCKSVHGNNSNNSIMIIDPGLSALV